MNLGKYRLIMPRHLKHSESSGPEGSPVAIKFATSREEIPAGMEELDKTIRHCSMVNLTRDEGKIFYASVGKHESSGGGVAPGLREITPTLKTGDFYFRLGKYDSAASCNGLSIKSPILVPRIPMQHCMPHSKRHHSPRMLL
jgi:uncharacterized protein (DUF169 family)